jgi:hypothetical protein
MTERKCWAAVAVLTLLIALVTSPPAWAQANVEQDRAVLCDTVEQLELFAAFKGDDASAVNAVNDKYQTHACAILVVAAVKGRKIKDVTIDGQVVELHEILVVGWFDGKAWRELHPFVQYTLYPTDDEGA